MPNVVGGRAMKIGSLFSGIGGLELGLEWSGLGRAVWQVEQDAYCRSVLAKHWPDARRFDDVNTFGSEVVRRERLPRVDLLCGGFPCQDVSGAGKGAGLSGARSGLWYQFARIAEELHPDWIVVENVASGAAKWVDAVRRDLGRIGYASLPVPLAARDVGAPHRRLRIFLVAHALQPRLEGPESEPAEGRGLADAGSAIHGGVGDADEARLQRGVLEEDEGREGSGDGRRALRAGVSDGDVGAVLDGQQRDAAGRANEVFNRGDPVAVHGGAVLADGGGDGPGVVGSSDVARAAREHDEARDFAHRRHEGMAHVFPPFRDDFDGWRRYLESGGPEPGLLSSAHGLPRGVARRRIAALGNAVVPQDAEVVGWVIRELIEAERTKQP